MTCGNCGRSHDAPLGCGCIPAEFWTRSEVAAALTPPGDVGTVVRLLRAHTDLTQEAIGNLAGLSQSAVSRLESGRRTITSPAKTTEILKRMGTPVDAADPDQSSAEPPRIVELRRLMNVYDLPDDGPTRPLTELRRAVSGVVSSRLDSRYTDLMDRLPHLIPELTRALFLQRGHQRSEVARLLVQSYRTADAVADKFGLYDLSARTIQVMLWASAHVEDECTLAAAAYVRAETFFATQTFEAGRHMLEQAAQRIRPDTSVRAAAAYGALHMRAAVLAARARQEDGARTHLAEARSIAKGVGEGVYAGTAFGPGSVRIHEVTLELDLGAPERALSAAAGWVPPACLPAERRSHFYIDTARAHMLTRRHEFVLDALEEARTTAPEHVRIHPDVHRILVELARAGGPEAPAAGKFAAAAGIFVPSFRSSLRG